MPWASAANDESGFGWDWIRYGKRGALRLCEQRGHEATRGREGQPQAGDRAIAGDVNQVGAERGREAAEDGGCQAVGQGEA